MLLAQADDLLYDNLKQDMCDVLGSVCLGAIMGNEVMFQYENSKFFDLCGVGGANNIIWNNVISDKNNGSDEDSTHLSPICAAVTTCHRVHFGHLLKVFIQASHILNSLTNEDARTAFLEKKIPLNEIPNIFFRNWPCISSHFRNHLFANDTSSSYFKATVMS